MSESTATNSAREREDKIAQASPPSADQAAAGEVGAGEQGTPPEAEGAAAPAGDSSPPSETERALSELRGQLEREKAAREASEAGQRTAEAEATYLRQRVQQGEISVRQAQLIAVSRALDAHVAQLDGYRDQYAQALSAGDFVKAAEIQANMSEAAAKKVNLASAKEQLERTPEPSPQAPAGGSDQAEAALRNYTPRTQSWLRSHPEVLRDPKRMQLAIAAHHAALAADHVADSDAYFDAIERTMGYKTDPPAQPSGARRPAASAPPSRNGSASGGAAVALGMRDMTPKMIQLAKEADMKPEEWLKSYNDLLSAGEIERMH